jgi:hypothetical protein
MVAQKVPRIVTTPMKRTHQPRTKLEPGRTMFRVRYAVTKIIVSGAAA